MIGSLLRYLLGSTVDVLFIGHFPLGTLVINYIGCVALGWVHVWFTLRHTIHPAVRAGVGTGLIGSFTTFSTFSAETVALYHDGFLLIAIIYVLVSVAGGLVLALLGMRWAWRQYADRCGADYGVEVDRHD